MGRWVGRKVGEWEDGLSQEVGWVERWVGQEGGWELDGSVAGWKDGKTV